MLRNPLVWVLGAFALVVAVPVGWYLLSPLWITRAVNEPLPTARVVGVASSATPLPPSPTVLMPAIMSAFTATPSASAPAFTETPSATVTPAATATALPTAGPQVVRQGHFYNIVHEGAGLASIYELADGARVLRLEEFMVLNGPDLFVYLVPPDPVPYTLGEDLAAYHDLGPLKGNVGDQNYDLPAGLDLSQYHSVLIWCRAFKVPFAAAPLAPNEG